MRRTKIVVPIMPESLTALEALEAEKFAAADIIEWRADFMPEEDILRAAPLVMKKFENYEILFTIRTQKEGGELDITEKNYIALIKAVDEFGPDYLDIEYFTHRRAYPSLAALKDKIVLSHHNFSEMPSNLTQRLIEMQNQHTAFVKAAVMPQRECDVLDIMQINRDLTLEYGPHFILIGMGSLGKISRIAGYLTGNPWTFASLEESSAPGQFSLAEAEAILEQLEGNVQI